MNSKTESDSVIPGSPGGDTLEHDSTVLGRFVRRPYGFEFFQAVRLIELAGVSALETGKWCKANPVGEDFEPGSESVRFRAAASQGFPGSEIVGFDVPVESNGQGDARSRAQMTVSFMGLTGPSGVLPRHYTQRLIDQLREDEGMREFFDIFNHRIISLFYRAWRKNHFAITYEFASRVNRHGMREASGESALRDPFLYGMYSLIGMGTGGLRERQQIPDEGLLYYAGQFAQHPRTAVSLERMIGDHFGWPTRVEQFVGQWLELRSADRTRLSSDASLGNNCLGRSTVAGERVWGIESKFRVRLGPLSYSKFRELIPGRRWLSPLAQFVRSYVGPDLDFDVQLVLRRDEVPACQLGGGSKAGSSLGWDCWLQGRRPIGRDVDDAVFQVDGYSVQ